MGGDHAPAEIIKGALEALDFYNDLHIILVGREEEIIKHLPQCRPVSRLMIHHCQDVIEMHEQPAIEYRKKKDASITVATRLVKEKEADAVVSAGSTGAQMVAALFGLGRIKGVARPAIGTVFPTLEGPKLLLDAGANTDCEPLNLIQFARMGKIYMEKILEISNPKVALVNIGEEPNKGNDLCVKTYEQLSREKDLNFVGNIEGRDILTGKADVMVCDGFVGNTILKVIEGTASVIFTLLKEEMRRNLRNKMGAYLLLPGLKSFKKRLDYSEYGGAPLLGVNGVSIICHGSSKAPAIKSAIGAAINCVRTEYTAEMQKSFLP